MNVILSVTVLHIGEFATMISKKEFENGINQIIKEFKLDNPKIEGKNYLKSKVGEDCLADINTKEHMISVHIQTQTKKDEEDPWDISYSLHIRNEFGLYLYSKVNHLIEEKHVTDFSRWISSAAHDYNLKKNHVSFLFGDRPIRIYGHKGHSASSALAFIVTLRGYAKCEPEKILVLKIRHIDKWDNYRSFSYAIFIGWYQFIYDYSYWAFFPDCMGLDSGAAYGSYSSVEEVIKEVNKKVPVKIVEIDALYNELEKLAEKWFDSDCYKEGDKNISYEKNPLVTTNIEKAIFQRYRNLRGSEMLELQKLLDKYNLTVEGIIDDLFDRNIGNVLRNLRMILQDVCEDICKKHNIKLSAKPSLTDVTNKLFESKIIDEGLKFSLLTYQKISSVASHKIFPKEKDIGTFEKRLKIRLITLTGLYSLLELLVRVRSSYGMDDVEFYEDG